MKGAAEAAAVERLLDALTGKDSSTATRESFRRMLGEGHLNDREVEIDVVEQPNTPFEIPGMGGQVGMIDLSDLMGKALGQQPRKRRRWRCAGWRNARGGMDRGSIRRRPTGPLADAEAASSSSTINKIAVSDVHGGSVSREGVQRDLLPLIEGTTVATKYGPMKTDHILFIASGAFHTSKPSDLLPELQGRLPIRVELKALTEEDFVRILSDTQASLTEQYRALLATEGVEVTFAEEGVRALARIAAEVNSEIENIGARRLQTVMEKLLEDVSFEAEERRGEKVIVDGAYVERQLADIARNADLSKYVL